MILLAFTTCQKKSPLSGEASILIGEWEWYKTTYVYDLCDKYINFQVMYSPETLGSEFKIRFNYPSEVQLIKNDSVYFSAVPVVTINDKNNTEWTYFTVHFNTKDSSPLSGRTDGVEMILSDFPYKHNNPSCYVYTNYFSKNY